MKTQFSTERTSKKSFVRRAIWERATKEPHIRWEKGQIQVKLAILARENITKDTFLEQKSTRVKFPPESKYEAPIDNATKHTEREGDGQIGKYKIVNSNYNGTSSEKKLRKQEPFCAERPWTLVDQKCVSLLHLSRQGKTGTVNPTGSTQQYLQSYYAQIVGGTRNNFLSTPQHHI